MCPGAHEAMMAYMCVVVLKTCSRARGILGSCRGK